MSDLEKQSRDKREGQRMKLFYPLELTLIAPNFLDRSYDGYMKDLSEGGACIELDDTYKRFEMIDKDESHVELVVEDRHRKRITLDSGICWMSSGFSENSRLRVGLVFRGLDDEKRERIRRLCENSRSDSRMLHALFDQHLREIDN